MRLFRRRAERAMSCAEVGKLLQRYLDDHLDVQRSQLLRAHLEDCRRCGLEAATYERIKASLAHHGAYGEDAALLRLRQFAANLVHDGGAR